MKLSMNGKFKTLVNSKNSKNLHLTLSEKVKLNTNKTNEKHRNAEDRPIWDSQ